MARTKGKVITSAKGRRKKAAERGHDEADEAWNELGLGEARTAKASAEALAAPEKRSCSLDVPVEFGAASGGSGTASLPVSVDASCLSPEQAVDLFVGRTLYGRVFNTLAGDAVGQTHIAGTFEKVELKAAFEVKKVSITRKRIGFTLCFKIDDVDGSKMFRLAKGSGRLVATELSDIAEKKRGRSKAAA